MRVKSSLLGPALIGLGVGLLCGTACESFLDGIIAGISMSIASWIIEVQPFSRGRRDYQQSGAATIAWGARTAAPGRATGDMARHGSWNGARRQRA